MKSQYPAHPRKGTVDTNDWCIKDFAHHIRRCRKIEATTCNLLYTAIVSSHVIEHMLFCGPVLEHSKNVGHF